MKLKTKNVTIFIICVMININLKGQISAIPDSTLNSIFSETYDLNLKIRNARKGLENTDTTIILNRIEELQRLQDNIITSKVADGLYTMDGVNNEYDKVSSSCKLLNEKYKGATGTDKINIERDLYICFNNQFYLNKVKGALADKMLADGLKKINTPNLPYSKELEDYKKQWAVFNKKAINLYTYSRLDADVVYEQGQYKYQIKIPSFVMPLVEYRNGENKTQEYLRAVEMTQPKPVFTLPYNYYLSTDAMYGNGKLSGYEVITGSFINQSRYKEDRDAFCALVDINENDLTKKVKWLIPISLKDNSGEEKNDFGVKIHTGSDGFIYVVVGSIKYSQQLYDYEDGHEAIFNFYKLDMNGNIVYSTSDKTKDGYNGIPLTITKLTKYRESIPVMSIFEDSKIPNCVNTVCKESIKPLKGAEYVKIQNDGSFKIKSDYALTFKRFDGVGSSIIERDGGLKIEKNTFHDDREQISFNNNKFNGTEEFKFYGGSIQDSDGNYYFVLNFNNELSYRIGDSFESIMGAAIARGDVSKYEFQIKSAQNYSQSETIKREFIQDKINRYKSATIKEERFLSKAIVEANSNSFYKSNFALIKLSSNFKLIFCKPFLSEEPRIIYSLKFDRASNLISLTGARSGFKGNQGGFSEPLKMDVDLDGNIINSNGRD